MKVLAIGNSFSMDATRYLHKIAKADNYNLKVVNLYIGGCPLRRHYNNILNDQEAYILEFNGESTGFMVSIREALQNDEWDFVTMQQASALSVNYDTYQPYLSELSKYVRKYAPKTKQVIHQTWAYEQNSPKLCDLGYSDQKEMFNDIKASYKMASDELGNLPIIPCGEAFQNAIKNGISKIHRDTFHASLGVGRYILAAVWYETLTGNSIMNNSFSEFDEEISDSDLQIARKTVAETIYNMRKEK